MWARGSRPMDLSCSCTSSSDVNSMTGPYRGPLPPAQFPFGFLRSVCYSLILRPRLLRNAREMESEPGWVAGKYVPLPDRASIQKRMHGKAQFEGLFPRAFL